MIALEPPVMLENNDIAENRFNGAFSQIVILFRGKTKLEHMLLRRNPKFHTRTTLRTAGQVQPGYQVL